MTIRDRIGQLLNWTFQDSGLMEWIIAAAIAVAVFLVLMLIRRIVSRRLRTALGRGHFRGSFALQLTADLIGRVHWLFMVMVSLFAGTYYVDLGEKARTFADAALPVAVFLQAAILASYALSAWVDEYSRRRRAEDPAAATTLTVARFIGKVAIWGAFALLALDNLGFNITTLVAGLGIGGVAVAFALQNILGDLFASVSIILDKPFETGDFIIVGDKMGTVERIGIKTVRVRSLSGEQIVFSNNDLLQSRIHNYKRMGERRVLFRIGVTYDTPVDKLRRAASIIREAIESQDKTKFDRANFSSFGDFSLIFEAVYFVLEPDYNLMMDIQENVNLALVREFEKEGIQFAFPTQTLYLQQSGSRKSADAAQGRAAPNPDASGGENGPGKAAG